MVRDDPTPSSRLPKTVGHPASALDTKLLGQAIIELNIARKNFSIYPSGHSQLERSILRAQSVLNQLLETTSELTLGVARDCLFVGDSCLDRKNPVFRDFSLALYSRDIAGVILLAGVSRDDIHGFCQVLTRDTFEIRESGGIQQVMRSASVKGIRVQPIDYSGLRLTEEQEIRTCAGSGKPDITSHVWRSFVSHLLSGRLDFNGQPEHLAVKRRIDPSQVAELLNSGLLNLQSAIESYEATIARYVRETTGDQPLENFVSLIKNLNPQLRSQFLSVTFDHVADPGKDGVLGGLPDDIIVEMLQQANDQGREISPTLITLLERISQIQPEQSLTFSEQAPTKSLRHPGQGLSRDAVKNLLHRESYETYVDQDYQSLLRNLVERTTALPGPGADRHPLDEPTAERYGVPKMQSRNIHLGGLASTINEQELDARLGRMILALMEQSADPDDYTVFSRKILMCVPEYLAAGDFELCHQIFRALRAHALEKPEPIRGIAEGSLLALHSPDIASAAVEALKTLPEGQHELAKSLIEAIGARCIPPLMDVYAHQEYPSPREDILNLLMGFGRAALDEAFRRFRGAPGPVLRNLLILVQRVGNQEAIDHVKHLLAHEDRQVSLDALVTLVELKDPEAPLHIRMALASAEPDEILKVIGLAGLYRIADVAQDLAGMIRVRMILKPAHKRNEEILKSLGKIGDVRVIPHLEVLARSAWSFSPNRLRELKRSLFESLWGYPRESLAGLIRIGRSSKDAQILKACHRLASMHREEGFNGAVVPALRPVPQRQVEYP